jgi:hypothetical protein
VGVTTTKDAKMRNYVFMLVAVIASANAQAYTIGGAYAQLISCRWGQYGYEYGNIGTYEVNGRTYEIFFGNSYCQY